MDDSQIIVLGIVIWSNTILGLFLGWLLHKLKVEKKYPFNNQDKIKCPYCAGIFYHEKDCEHYSGVILKK